MADWIFGIDYVFSVDGAETGAVKNLETAVVYNLDFFDTTDDVSGAGIRFWSTLAFDIGGDIDLDLTSYPGVTGFSNIQARSATGGIHLTIAPGVHRISAESFSNSPVVLDASALTSWPNGGPVELLAKSGGANVLIGGAFDDELRSGAGADKLHGGAGADLLSGGFGADVLYGGAGADLLYGAAGADVLYGGDGIDTADYSGSSVGVTVSLAAGTGGDAEGDTLREIENLTGSAFADRLTGGADANMLDGGAGDDMLRGGAGADRMIGGAGNDISEAGAGADTIMGGAGIDTASYAGSAGAVTVHLQVGTDLGGDAEGDTLTGIEQVIGSGFNDVLSGDAGSNTLWGGAGDDVLTGGAGADVLKGGAGNDRFVYAAIGDSTVAASGKDTIADFATGDRIDLSGVDADGNSANGDTVFSFGAGGFTGTPGELRIVAFSDGRQGVYLDVNGDKQPDSIITVYADHALTAADFVL